MWGFLFPIYLYIKIEYYEKGKIKRKRFTTYC